MPLLHPTDPLRKNDVLASNLLFATLAILLGEHLYGRLMPGPHLNVEMLPAGAPWWRILAMLSFSFLLRGALYYGVRRGLLFAKLLLAIGFVAWVYKGSDWQQGYVAGVSFVQFTGWPSPPTPAPTYCAFCGRR